MKVFRATTFGFDRTAFIIAANSATEALEIVRNQDMGTVDSDDVWECDQLETSATESEVLEQF